ncbi:radical SAM enzyme, Cfr family [Acidimicrobium ferrooxidans DSM 10331]|uniref:Probable dual-specificity RNA methyltransferase RlmN n=1 Tax=Acidimicrobium ferrooxidans (strain DSM 10331 / JCM 15462 / NBRC 103882 / ICP) TaxID=525909 RepID=C7M235_ACIFD|nr:23S rRNA (adenine(2503)-C(2))-methyltransferase RlmN [Acidimicrobium ferrooxidans]ACU53133.1 radical SAM enzyme, Cfr family [Acidimicrobium ferrooxidans DSM 10331]
MASVYELDRAAVRALVPWPDWRIEQLFHGLYHEGQRLEAISTLPARMRAELASHLDPGLTERRREHADDGETVKFALEAADGALVETVVMQSARRISVCVSSQAGCAMGCRFCATGQAGFVRHLGVGEIVEQLAIAQRSVRPRRLTHVVFMGMGEPLANASVAIEAIRRIRADFGISPRRVTVSTVGIVPGIRRLAHADLGVTLAVSLHAANDAARSDLVPMNRRYGIDAVLDAAQEFSELTGRRVTLEWALIAGVNDRDRDATELAGHARRLAAHVNLIPLNPTPGYPMVGTDPDGVARFARRLRSLGVNVTVRDTRGRSIDAACGQLAADVARGGPAGASAVRFARRMVSA